MPFAVQTTLLAKVKMRALLRKSLHDFVEVNTVLSNLSQTGLIVKDHIAVVNHSHDVHFLEPATGPHILTISDTSKNSSITVTDLNDSLTTPLASVTKRRLAEQAADAVGIVHYHIHIV